MFCLQIHCLSLHLVTLALATNLSIQYSLRKHYLGTDAWAQAGLPVE